MGRHVEPGDGSFRRSVAATLARTVLLVLVVAAVTLLASRVGGGKGTEAGDPVIRGPARASASASDDLPPDPGDAIEPEAPATGRSASPSAGPVPPSDAPSMDRSSTGAPVGTPTASAPPAATVQILFEGATRLAADDARAALEALGYEVVAVNAVRRRIDVTTALAVEGHEEAARQLAAREPRIAEVRPNARYSDAVDVHLLVGRDWGAGHSPAG